MSFPEAEVALWVSILVVVYTYAGYLGLLLLLARLRPAPCVKKASITPGVSMLIVAHNEGQCLEDKLRNCLLLDYPPDALEVVVVSDGSTDSTEGIAESFASQGVRLIALPGPRGKAVSLNQAVPRCRGEILVLSDARQHIARDAIRQLVANFADPSVGAVSGELHLAPSGSAVAEGVGFYWRYEKVIRRLESDLDSTVGVTGAIYAVRRELFRPVDPRTILDDVMIPMNVVLQGFRVLFEPRARAYDQIHQNPWKEYRRKVRTLAGNYQLVMLRPVLMSPFRNRLFWQFISHKLLRLAVPWCLCALLATSAVLSLREGALLYRGLFAAQIIFYLLAAIGGVSQRSRTLPRLLSLPHSFVLLNLAAASALIGFLMGREKAAWKPKVADGSRLP